MRVAIVGGSMAGMFAAALLQRSGHAVQVFERSRSGLEGRGAGLVAQSEVFSLLEVLGLGDMARTGVVARERITLDRAGAVVRRDRHPQMQISWDRLYSALRSRLEDGSYRTGRGVVAAGQEQDAAWLRFEDGTQVDADLVIGADGIGSVIRPAVLGRKTEVTYAGYVAWRALLPETALPEEAAGVLSDRFAFHHAPRSQVLGYTIPGPSGELEAGRRRYNCVWYRRTDDLRAALTDVAGRHHPFSIPPGGIADAARERLVADAEELLPPPFAAVIVAETRPFLQAVFDMETERMVNGRLALIGDAAFVARPHTAMGVAKAAGDALAVASAVAQGWSAAAQSAFELDRTTVGKSIVEYGKRLGSSLGVATPLSV